jgi:hypothetical protein
VSSLQALIFVHYWLQCRCPLCPAAKYSEKDKCSKTNPPVNLIHPICGKIVSVPQPALSCPQAPPIKQRSSPAKRLLPPISTVSRPASKHAPGPRKSAYWLIGRLLSPGM